MTSASIQRSSERFVTNAGWLDSKHSFNFGNHYLPQHDGFGLLLVHNDDIVAPGAGFGMHGHRDMEIVTWVLSGRLEHRDSEGNHGVLYPGLAQRMSAGSGIRHSEMNASSQDPVHFLQMWVLPHRQGIKPGYEQRDINADLVGGNLVAIASGQGHPSAVAIHQENAVLYGARLHAGQTIAVPPATHVHVFVAKGAGALNDGRSLNTADAARLTHPDEASFTAETDETELLIWATS